VCALTASYNTAFLNGQTPGGSARGFPS